jgi:hypothetical protein
VTGKARIHSSSPWHIPNKRELNKLRRDYDVVTNNCVERILGVGLEHKNGGISINRKDLILKLCQTYGINADNKKRPLQNSTNLKPNCTNKEYASLVGKLRYNADYTSG